MNIRMSQVVKHVWNVYFASIFLVFHWKSRWSIVKLISDLQLLGSNIKFVSNIKDRISHFLQFGTRRQQLHFRREPPEVVQRNFKFFGGRFPAESTRLLAGRRQCRHRRWSRRRRGQSEAKAELWTGWTKS